MVKKDISNKALAGLLIAAIFISLSGTMMIVDKKAGITGYDTYTNETGTANVNISGTVSIALPVNTYSFGTGYITAGNSNCWILGYDGGVADWIDNFSAYDEQACSSGFTGSPSVITVENDGNVVANVTVKATKTAANFIGGTSPSVKFATGGNGCDGTAATDKDNLPDDVSGQPELGTTALNFCDALDYTGDGGADDTFKFYLLLKIPSDAVGYKTNSVIFEATQSS